MTSEEAPRSRSSRLASHLRAVVELMRAWNCVVVVVGVVLGAALVTGRMPRAPGPYAAALAAFLVTAGGNGLNDFYDAAIDRLNKPGRPIPSGRLTRNAARNYSIGLLAGGAALAWSLNPYAGGLATFNAILLAAYARDGKGWLGFSNVSVAYLVASVFLFGALSAVPGLLALSPGVLAIAFCAFLAALALEILKDVEDIPGDRAYGARTLPIVWGQSRARALAMGAMIAAVLLSPMVWLAAGLHAVYLAAVTLADGLLLSGAVAEPAKGRKRISLGMGAVMVALFLGIVWANIF